MASKQETKKKKTSASKAINVQIDLGPVTATAEQIARLKAHVKNEVRTWVRSDLGERGVPVGKPEIGQIPAHDDDES